MKFSYSKKKLIVIISILLIYEIIIILPIYFLVIKKSTSNNNNKTIFINSDKTTFNNSDKTTFNNNELGFCFVTNTNGIDSKKIFLPNSTWGNNAWFNITKIDNGQDAPLPNTYYGETSVNTPTPLINKWVYDKNNSLTIERTIKNINGAYSKDELNSLGTTSTIDTYLVNKIIPTFNRNISPEEIKNIPLVITPYILSLYSDCK